MSDTFKIILDGREATARRGQTVLEAADDAGIYIPRLCAHPELTPHGSCRVCTVRINGRACAACTQPAAPHMIVEVETDELTALRRSLVEMLLVEGNHFCMSCEKSGNCELQALSYRLQILSPEHRYLFPVRPVDASHPDLLLESNRCVLCGRCERAARELDGHVGFGMVGRGGARRLAVNARGALGDSPIRAGDRAASICPVGALLPKRVGFAVPVGQRSYDTHPIGSQKGNG